MRDYLGAIWTRRYFWLSLVRMDLRTRYRLSWLGLGWSLLQPVAFTAVLCLVFHELFRLPIAEFAPYVLCGLSVWNYVVHCILGGADCIRHGETFLRHCPAPLAVFPLRTVLGGAFHLGIALVLALAVRMLFIGPIPMTSLFLALLGMIPLLIAGWALACILGLMNVWFPDSRHLAEVGLQLAFYATPIIYPPSILQGRWWTEILILNPFSALLAVVRDPIVNGTSATLTQTALACGWALALTVVAAGLLAKCERKLIYHL